MPGLPDHLGQEIELSSEEANSFLTRKLLENSSLHFEEIQQGNLERECLEERCSWEEAREVFEYDINGLDQFWSQYTGQSDGSSQANFLGIMIAVLCGIAGLLILVITCYVIWRKRKRHLARKDGSQSYYPQHMIDPPEKNATNNQYETPIIDVYDSDLALGISECYLERERLEVGELITSGNFGEVHKGELRMRDGLIVSVAVKSLLTIDDRDNIEKLLREGVMMRGLDHKHVLSLIGVCIEDDDLRKSPLIVLPFMENGDLRTFLRDGDNILTVMHLLRFCFHVAQGMEYLANEKFVHRDLAARNCMVDGKWCVKVADFGLSRDLFDRDYYTSKAKTQLPLKWMPPESIKYRRYDEKTDVWSFGVVCWEIMTRGAIPYPTVHAVAILQYLSDGSRMEKPECCPSELYSTMKTCWLDEPCDRPSFAKIVMATGNIVKAAKKISDRQSHRTSDMSSRAHGENAYQNSDVELLLTRRDGRRGEGRSELRPKSRSIPVDKQSNGLKLSHTEMRECYDSDDGGFRERTGSTQV